MILFGSTASIIVDINLIIQIVILLLLIYGIVRAKPYKLHGNVMRIVTLLTLVSILLIMAPALILNFMTVSPSLYLHAAMGIAAVLLGFLFASRMYKAEQEGKPLLCGSRRIMWVAYILWMLPMLGGIAYYIQTYLL